MHIEQLESPAAVVDLDKLSANITRLQSYLDEHAIANRPHIKTHKIPEIAHMQVDAGAVGYYLPEVGRGRGDGPLWHQRHPLALQSAG